MEGDPEGLLLLSEVAEAGRDLFWLGGHVGGVEDEHVDLLEAEGAQAVAVEDVAEDPVVGEHLLCVGAGVEVDVDGDGEGGAAALLLELVAVVRDEDAGAGADFDDDGVLGNGGEVFEDGVEHEVGVGAGRVDVALGHGYVQH